MDTIPTIKEGQTIHINQPEHDYNPPPSPLLGWLIGAVISLGLWVLIALTIGSFVSLLGW